MGNLDRENKRNSIASRAEFFLIYGQYRFKNTYMGNLDRESKQKSRALRGFFLINIWAIKLKNTYIGNIGLKTLIWAI